MIYERIRELRENNEWTQQYMAHFLHVNQRTYSRYETGEHAVPIDVLCKIADLHKVSVDYLLDRTDYKKQYPRKGR